MGTTDAAMTCREVTEFLADYLAGTLPVRERAVFDAHVVDCDACIAYLQSYRQAMAAAKDVAVFDDAKTVPPPELIDAILAAARDRRPR